MSQFGGGRNPVLEQVVADFNDRFEKTLARLEKVEAALEENSNAKRATKRPAVSRSNAKPGDDA